MGPPNWGVWSAADTALFVAIRRHQKHIRVKLKLKINKRIVNKRKSKWTPSFIR